MKIWRFYTKSGTVFGSGYSLYAITNKKKLAKKFKKERDMDLFIEKCSEENEDTWKDIVRDNQDALLKVHYLNTGYDNENTSLISSMEVPIVCTMFEYQTSDADFAAFNILTTDFWDHMVTEKLFKRKLTEALKILEYDKFYKIYNSKVDPDEYDDYDIPTIEIDEVGVLINAFNYTFKSKA